MSITPISSDTGPSNETPRVSTPELLARRHAVLAATAGCISQEEADAVLAALTELFAPRDEADEWAANP